MFSHFFPSKEGARAIPCPTPALHGGFLCSYFTAWIQQQDLWAGAELGMCTGLVSGDLGLAMQNGGAERLLQLQGGRNWREVILGQIPAPSTE